MTIRPQLAQFLVNQTRHHSNRILLCTRYKRHNGRWEHKFCFPNHVSRIMSDTCLQAKRWIIYSDEFMSCSSCSDNCSVFPFCCGLRSTAAILTLISSIVYPLLPASSNRRIILTKMSSDCSTNLNRLFRPNWATSFKFWHMYVMCKNPAQRHFYSRRKILAVEMQQKFWPSDWESLLICTCCQR